MRKKHICQLVSCIVVLVFVGCNKQFQEKKLCLPITQNEYKEIDDIINYKYGVTDILKKKMILSEITRHYALESEYSIDSIAPVILVSYEKRFKNFNVYCIRRTDPWIFDEPEVTELDLLGQYIVAYSIPNEDMLTKQAIKQAGIRTRCPYLTVHETAWFVFLSPDMLNYTIVKDIFSIEEACEEFEKQNKIRL